MARQLRVSEAETFFATLDAAAAAGDVVSRDGVSHDEAQRESSGAAGELLAYALHRGRFQGAMPESPPLEPGSVAEADMFLAAVGKSIRSTQSASARRIFSKMISSLTLHTERPKALTFENLLQHGPLLPAGGGARRAPLRGGAAAV